jgi:hypothetical protein
MSTIDRGFSSDNIISEGRARVNLLISTKILKFDIEYIRNQPNIGYHRSGNANIARKQYPQYAYQTRYIVFGRWNVCNPSK